MSPDKDSPTPPKNQEIRRTPRNEGRQCRARGPRSRVCLLKGCGQIFRPQQPMTRYCSNACREKARQWRRWKARQRYRHSPNGKQKRQAQSRRYRQRRKEQPAARNGRLRREGHPYEIFFRTPATARAAIRSSIGVGGHPYNGFVPQPAATLWSAFWSGRGAGVSGGSNRSGEETPQEPGVPCGDKSLPISSGHIALTLAVSISSACAQPEEEGVRSVEDHAASFSLLH